MRPTVSRRRKFYFLPSENIVQKVTAMYTIGLAWCCHLLGQSLTLNPLEIFFSTLICTINLSKNALARHISSYYLTV